MDLRKTETLHRFIDGELSEPETAALEEQLGSDPELAEYLAGLQQIHRAAGALEVMAAPRIDPADRPQPWHRFLARMGPIAAGVAAAAACVAIGFGIAGMTGPPPPTGQQTSLRLVYYAPEADSVSVIGDFNNWAGEIPLRARGGSGYWQVELEVEPGEYHYTLILNGREQVTDPTADYVVDDDFGSKNSVVRVGI